MQNEGYLILKNNWFRSCFFLLKSNIPSILHYIHIYNREKCSFINNCLNCRLVLFSCASLIAGIAFSSPKFQYCGMSSFIYTAILGSTAVATITVIAVYFKTNSLAKDWKTSLPHTLLPLCKVSGSYYGFVV